MDYGYLATQGSDLQEDLLSHYFRVHLKYCQVLFDDLIRWRRLLKDQRARRLWLSFTGKLIPVQRRKTGIDPVADSLLASDVPLCTAQ